jgi:leucyl aminopeptidase
MDISASASASLKTQVDLLVIASDDQDAPIETPAIAEIDKALAGSLLHAMSAQRFSGKPGQVLVIHTQGRVPATQVALVGTESRDTQTASALKTLGGRAVRLAAAQGATSLALLLPARLLKDPATAAQTLTEGLLLGDYHFDKYLSADRQSQHSLRTSQLLLGEAAAASSTASSIARGQSTASAVMRARDLVNEPAAVMTPSRMADVAREMASKHGLELIVLGPTECKKRGMALFCAVAQGSTEEPRFIHLAHKPKGAQKRVVLVGKGVTFDSGGLSLKPSDSMMDMKIDMAGAAAVLSAVEAAAREKLNVEVHALAACTENMPSGSAYKLGDVVKSRVGPSVEIANTDAEGRLTLGDALSYGVDLKPDAMFDFATLTGACMVALGPHIAGVMSNDEALTETWLAAAESAGEDMWRLPLSDRLFEQIKSDVADMKNSGKRYGGAITAGLFLKEFVGQVPWVHVDIAGPASAEKEHGHIGKGGTGFAVATMLAYLRQIAAG